MRVAGVQLGVEGGAVADSVESAVERVRAAAAEVDPERAAAV